MGEKNSDVSSEIGTIRNSRLHKRYACNVMWYSVAVLQFDKDSGDEF